MSGRRKGNDRLPLTEAAATSEVVICSELEQPNTANVALQLCNPQPITRPVVDPAILELAALQRSIQVILYWLARIEHWLSPTGWLRAWIRLNLWVAVVLAACAFTVVPAITAVVAGLTGLTLELSRISDDLGRSFASLLPLLSALILLGVGFYFTRRHPEQCAWLKLNNHENRKEESK